MQQSPGHPGAAMTGRTARLTCAVAVSTLVFAMHGGEAALAQPAADLPQPTSKGMLFYREKVEPLLAEHCWKCHSGQTPKGSLRLDFRGGLLQGGETGPAVDVEDLKNSLILDAIHYRGLEMPPRGKLSPEDLSVLSQWVLEGVPGPAEAPVAPPPKPGPPEINAANRAFWSFQQVRRPAPPQSTYANRGQSPIDAFIQARLESAGLSPAPPASKTELIRRASYDLIGLPPTVEEVSEFLGDVSPDAFSKLVDRLLESPHYGEHWGRHWLDLVRYAETNSYERDGAKPFVWRYRDYVIRSFNDDKPYDEFIREQLAGDELPEPSAEQLIATGYYRLGIWDDEPVDAEQAYFDDLDDVLSTTGQVFLGLTIGCARCHDHKLDPIPQRDYYRMLSFFTNIRRYGVRGHDTVLDASVRMAGPLDVVRRREQEIKDWKTATQENKQQLAAIEKRLGPLLKGGEKDDFQDEARRVAILRNHAGDLVTTEELAQYEALVQERQKLRASQPEGLKQVLCVKENGPDPRPTHVLFRGSAKAPGDEVQPGYPAVLGFDDPPAIPPSPDGLSSGRRTMLAQWIANHHNPLTARVMVNRVWQFHLGRGLVSTSSDFGLQGDPPTHPQLLDWLAAELMEGGWKLKRLHKLIMLSDAYQMSSQASSEGLAKDPSNVLLWRFNRRRLTAEEIRDSVLAASGSLRRDKMFGPSVYSKIPVEVLAGQSQPGAGWGESAPEDRFRRSIYIHVKRSLLTPVLSSFDYPEPDFSCPVRFVSTQPTQSLGMLNGEFINEQAAAFAEDLMRRYGESAETQVREALRRVTQRMPAEEEVQEGLDLITQLQQKHQISSVEALRQFCLLALNLNEFVYLD